MESHFERVLSAETAPKRLAASSSSTPLRNVLVYPLKLMRRRSTQLRPRTQVDGQFSQETRAAQRSSARKARGRSYQVLGVGTGTGRQLTRWKQVAAKPELFAVMMELQVPRVLLGLFAHENLDIRLAVLSLLAELTDVDDAATSLEPARMLTKHLIDEKLLHCCDGGQKYGGSRARGVRPSGGYVDLAFSIETSGTWEEFSENKLYASEILSILLQSGAEPRENFVAWMGKDRPSEEKKEKNEKVDLMDDLLQALAPYRKKDPSSEEEEELVGNLVNALCSVLLVPEAQKQFRRLEGLELLLRFMKDRKRLVFGGALRAMDHALMGNARNCERLVEIGGLRSVFSVFMGRHGKYKSSSSSKASKANEKAKEEENAASLVASMCAWMREKAPADGYDRLHAKFVENDMEKVDRLVDLFAKYHERVERSGQDEDEEEEDEDSRYLRRLDAGLFVLERIAFVVAHLCRFSKKLRAYVMVKFHERSLDTESLVTILREQLDLLVADEEVKKEDEQDNAKEAKDVVNDEAKEAQKAQLRELLETLEADETPLINEKDGATETKPGETKVENGDKTGMVEPAS
ncbi:Armadillo-type fold [Phytophthora cactorum]|nr:Armadillo-type fold [Phytophthora cactorum]